jgi:hypothetical protein
MPDSEGWPLTLLTGIIWTEKILLETNIVAYFILIIEEELMLLFRIRIRLFRIELLKEINVV